MPAHLSRAQLHCGKAPPAAVPSSRTSICPQPWFSSDYGSVGCSNQSRTGVQVQGQLPVASDTVRRPTCPTGRLGVTTSEFSIRDGNPPNGAQLSC